MSKNEFPLTEQPFFSEIKLFIERSRQHVDFTVNSTLSAVIDEPVKDFPLIHFLKWSEQ